MATVQDHHDVGAVVGHLPDQLVELLVGQVTDTVGAAVGADDGLVLPGRLQEPEAILDRLARAVPAVGEQRDVAGAGLTEVRLEPLDDPLACRVPVEQLLGLVAAFADAGGENLGQRLDVGDTAAQRRGIAAVVVDADE
jgi:hypothetical protein